MAQDWELGERGCRTCFTDHPLVGRQPVEHACCSDHTGTQHSARTKLSCAALVRWLPMLYNVSLVSYLSTLVPRDLYTVTNKTKEIAIHIIFSGN